MKLHLYDMRVFVKPDEEKTMSDGGLHLPVQDSSTIPYRTGVVIATGQIDTIKVGDRLLWKRSRGMPIFENRREVGLLLERDDVMAKVLPEEEQ